MNGGLPTPQEPLDDAREDIQNVSKWSKVFRAFSLSVDSWPAQVRDSAKQAFGDPHFLTALVAVTGFYVYLWLTPDPTLLTKVFASGLTIYLWAQFAWEDIWGTAQALYVLTEQCERAQTEEELQAAGDTFAKKVGQVGFDILLMSVMWKVGKTAQPKLTQYGVKRAVAAAEAQASIAKYQPGTKNIRPAQGKALNLLKEAEASAGSQEPSRILDALAEKLSPAARQGLAEYRKEMSGDAQILRALESKLGKGGDVDSYLSHKGVTPGQASEATALHLKAHQRLARLQLIQQKITTDPTLRKAASDEIARQELERMMGTELQESVNKEVARLEAVYAKDPTRSKPVREKVMRKKLVNLLDPACVNLCARRLSASSWTC